MRLGDTEHFFATKVMAMGQGRDTEELNKRSNEIQVLPWFNGQVQTQSHMRPSGEGNKVRLIHKQTEA